MTRRDACKASVVVFLAAVYLAVVTVNQILWTIKFLQKIYDLPNSKQNYKNVTAT